MEAITSAIFCISGTQSARRSAEGFDMVRLSFSTPRRRTYSSAICQINVTTDTGALSEGIAMHLAAAVKE